MGAMQGLGEHNSTLSSQPPLTHYPGATGALEDSSTACCGRRGCPGTPLGMTPAVAFERTNWNLLSLHGAVASLPEWMVSPTLLDQIILATEL